MPRNAPLSLLVVCRFTGIRKTGEPVGWERKLAFYCCANTRRMALQQPVFQDRRGDEMTAELDPEYVKKLGQDLGIVGDPVVQHTRGAYALADTKGSFISVLNLATLREFEKFIGHSVDPRRFRMNVHIDHLAPFVEYEWVPMYPGDRIIVGGESGVFRVDDACERCRAIDQNPDTGEFDERIGNKLLAFMASREYKSPKRKTPCVMGVYLAPLVYASLKLGDTLGPEA